MPGKSRIETVRTVLPEKTNIFSETGKVMPQAVEFEEAVLGAIMIDKNAINAVIDFLLPVMFYKENHQQIYKAILALFKAGAPIDLMTVTNECKSQGILELVGGPYYITTLVARIVSSANIEYHARIILQKHLSRKIITDCNDLSVLAFEDTTDIFDLTDKFGLLALEFNQEVSSSKIESTKELAEQAKKHAEDVRSGHIEETAIMCGVKELDDLLFGFKPPDNVIIAGRPGMGKTALLMSMAIFIAGNGTPVGIFSLEMSKRQLTLRACSQKTNMSYQQLARTKELTDFQKQAYFEALDWFGTLPMFIDDDGGITMNQLRAKANVMKLEHNVKIIFIDYLQLMNGEGRKGNREEEISTISRGIKQLAKDLNIPIVPLSQLNRAVEARGDKKPNLADLRESGSIEQDADVVILMFRPAYYGIEEDNNPNISERKTPEEMKVLTILNIAKHRAGPLDMIEVKFVEKLMRFTGLHESDVMDEAQIEMDYQIESQHKPNDNNPF